MTIQITLHSNEIKKAGKHEKREYDSLQIKRFGNGRIYLTAIKNNMRMFEVRKQMQLENGKVFLSFGKNDKLEIGTYTE
jgi:hypothetical protein